MVLLGEHNPLARHRGFGGGLQTRRSATDDQHVTVQVAQLVAIGISLGRCAAQPGHAADAGFIRVPAGPDERLVIEAGSP